MKKNSLVKLALVSLAFVCMSGQVARVDNRQTALTKCTKAPENLADEPGGESNTSKVTHETSQKAPSDKHKGAAKKAVDLEMYGTSANAEVRKSAAKRAMEAVD